jgi:peptidoglycan/LPS O-acetylase OafA/YrhL
LPVDKDSAGEMHFDPDAVCMGWTWYLGNDFIFSFITVALMPVYYARKNIAWLIAALLIIGSCAITTYDIVQYNLGAYVFDDNYRAYSDMAYSRPWNRIPAYLVGVCAGWLLAELRANKWEVPSRMVCTAINLAAVGFLFFVIFIVKTDFGAQKDGWGGVENALYLCFARPFWAASLAVISFSCIGNTFLPYMNEFLSLKIWVPLARLTYGAYLMHPVIIKLLAGSMDDYYHFGASDVFYRLVGNVLLSFFAAFWVFVLVERPMMTISGLIMGRFTGRGKPEAK